MNTQKELLFWQIMSSKKNLLCNFSRKRIYEKINLDSLNLECSDYFLIS
jgi:hypothetical protein